jgi:hypothetical protein
MDTIIKTDHLSIQTFFEIVSISKSVTRIGLWKWLRSVQIGDGSIFLFLPISHGAWLSVLKK